jgi:hypothetical protein
MVRNDVLSIVRNGAAGERLAYPPARRDSGGPVISQQPDKVWVLVKRGPGAGFVLLPAKESPPRHLLPLRITDDDSGNLDADDDEEGGGGAGEDGEGHAVTKEVGPGGAWGSAEAGATKGAVALVDFT